MCIRDSILAEKSFVGDCFLEFINLNNKIKPHLTIKHYVIDTRSECYNVAHDFKIKNMFCTKKISA